MLLRSNLNRAKQAAEHPLDVTTGPELASAAKAWKHATVLGVDTEFIRERTYYAQLALIQVSDGRSVWLIDPLALGELDPFVDMLKDTAITKVLHAPSEDLELMQHLFSTLPDPMFDTQLAATAVGQPLQLSYNRVVEWLLDELLDSSSTRSDWMRRPLSGAQRHYAALDVAYLPLMHGMLDSRLQTAGRRGWHAEDCRRMCEQLSSLPAPEQMYLRIREAYRLEQEQLNVLQRLTSWRETRARKINRPRKYVLSDNNLLDIARELPASRSQLRNTTELNSRLLERQGAAILQTVKEGRNTTADAPGPPEPLNAGERKICVKLQQMVQARAESLGVQATWLATRKDLESLIRCKGEFSGNGKLTGWRKVEVIDELVAQVAAK